MVCLLSLLGACVPGQAQSILYATTGAQLNGYNLGTHTVNYALATGLSFPMQSATGPGGLVYMTLYGQSQVAVYNPAGQTLNSAFLPAGVNSIAGVAVWNNTLYVAQGGGIQRISTYNATTGALLSANFITGVYNPNSVVIDGQGRLYVTTNNAQVSVYDAASAQLLNAALVSVNNPLSLAVDSSGTLFVNSLSNSTIGAYSALTGAAINASLITGLNSPQALATDNLGHLFVSDYNANGGYYQVDQFNAATGALQTSGFMISGSSIGSLSVYAVPEPSTWALCAGGLGLLWLGRRSGRGRA
jgi:streptogramin lyase